MNVELSKFKVKQGKSSFVDEWTTFLNDEKMYVELLEIPLLF
nr:DUF6176 family protein [Paraliobacillus ryukyuensis]